MVLNSASPWTDQQMLVFWLWNENQVKESVNHAEYLHIIGCTELAVECIKHILLSEKNVSVTLRQEFNSKRDEVKEAEGARFQPSAPPALPVDWTALASEEICSHEASVSQICNGNTRFHDLLMYAQSAIANYFEDQRFYMEEFNVLHHRCARLVE